MTRKTVKRPPAPPRLPLAELMAAQGVSLAELSRRTGITQPLLRAYRAGHTQPTYPALLRLAAALEVDFAALAPATKEGGRHAV